MSGSQEMRHHASEVEDLGVGVARGCRSFLVGQFQVLTGVRTHAVGDGLAGEDEADHPPMDRALPHRGWLAAHDNRLLTVTKANQLLGLVPVDDPAPPSGWPRRVS